MKYEIRRDLLDSRQRLFDSLPREKQKELCTCDSAIEYMNMYRCDNEGAQIKSISIYFDEDDKDYFRYDAYDADGYIHEGKCGINRIVEYTLYKMFKGLIE